MKCVSKYIVSVLALSALTAFAFDFSSAFTQGNWTLNDWTLVKSPRFPNRGSWLQESDGIRNRVPDIVITPAEVRAMKAYAGKTLTDAEALAAARVEVQKLLQGKRNPETLTSMVLKQKVSGRKIRFSATMSFEYRMAPGLVFANELGTAADGLPEYNEYWEIIFYDQGLNVWHHEIRDGKPFWRKAAFVKAPFAANESATVTAEVVFTDKCPMLTVTCGATEFGCMIPSLNKEFYVGIMACEGVNHFKDFAVSAR